LVPPFPFLNSIVKVLLVLLPLGVVTVTATFPLPTLDNDSKAEVMVAASAFQAIADVVCPLKLKL
jgi:hypothetical protein